MTVASCEKHPFEMAESACFDCGHDCCGSCLIYARGPKRPPICVECTVAAGGVRCNAGRTPKYVPKDMKKLRKQLLAELRSRGEMLPIPAEPIGQSMPEPALLAQEWADDWDTPSAFATGS